MGLLYGQIRVPNCNVGRALIDNCWQNVSMVVGACAQCVRCKQCPVIPGHSGLQTIKICRYLILITLDEEHCLTTLAIAEAQRMIVAREFRKLPNIGLCLLSGDVSCICRFCRPPLKLHIQCSFKCSTGGYWVVWQRTICESITRRTTQQTSFQRRISVNISKFQLMGPFALQRADQIGGGGGKGRIKTATCSYETLQKDFIQNAWGNTCKNIWMNFQQKNETTIQVMGVGNGGVYRASVVQYEFRWGGLSESMVGWVERSLLITNRDRMGDIHIHNHRIRHTCEKKIRNRNWFPWHGCSKSGMASSMWETWTIYASIPNGPSISMRLYLTCDCHAWKMLLLIRVKLEIVVCSYQFG